jgi:hypothetical protein
LFRSYYWYQQIECDRFRLTYDLVFRILSASTQALAAFTLIYISKMVYMIFFTSWTCLSMLCAFFLSESMIESLIIIFIRFLRLVEFAHLLQEHSPPMLYEADISHHVVQVGVTSHSARYYIVFRPDFNLSSYM